MATQGKAIVQAGRDGADGTFTRKSVKYVIRNCYVPALKAALEKNMGCSPFTLSTGEVVNSQPVHSVYFDNEELVQYHERVVKADKSKLVRIRWYGDSMARSAVFIERKKHHDQEAKSQGKESSKKRAELPLARVEAYLNNTWRYEGENVPGFIAKTQNLVAERQLRPMLQTLYDRTSYQNNNNKNLRITLDENVRCYRERKTWAEIAAADGRPVGTPATMGFAVMEVKLKKDPSLRIKDHYPEWLLEQLESDHVSKIKISKYNYGISNLYPEKVYIAPLWQDDINAFMSDGPGAAPALPPKGAMAKTTAGSVPRSGAAMNVGRDGEASSVTLLDTNSTGSQNDSRRDLLGPGSGSSKKKGAWNMPKWMGGAMTKSTKNDDKKPPPRQPLPSIFRPAGRFCGIDAKALLANERNYFHWVRMSVFMAVFSLGLIHLGGVGVREKVTAVTCVIDVVIVYATIQFHRRAREITRNASDPAVKIFYSKYGPTMFATFLALFFTGYMLVLWIFGTAHHAYVAADVANLALISAQAGP